jgi:hypothetical protein
MLEIMLYQAETTLELPQLITLLQIISPVGI